MGGERKKKTVCGYTSKVDLCNFFDQQENCQKTAQIISEYDFGGQEKTLEESKCFCFYTFKTEHFEFSKWHFNFKTGLCGGWSHTLKLGTSGEPLSTPGHGLGILGVTADFLEKKPEPAQERYMPTLHIVYCCTITACVDAPVFSHHSSSFTYIPQSCPFFVSSSVLHSLLLITSWALLSSLQSPFLYSSTRFRK